MDRLDKYLSITPNVCQKRIQRENFNVFFHYGLNTFTGKEWGDGKVDPKEFNPGEQDTDQWIRIAKEAGAYGVILTCKHHDGFCLWPTETTDYSVAASPYKQGKGDVVREVSDSCKKYSLKFGIYLSPWDRNNESYGQGEAYNDLYCRQLTELLTNYGEVFTVWLDGACGSYMDGKPKQEYDWARYFDTIKRLAPNACISNCGPDVRWVGNEGGFARESEFNVVPRFACDVQTIEANSQQSDDGTFVKKGADIVSSDLGSRKFLENFDEFMWYPAEVDVSIRPGWFYHKSQDKMVRSADNLKRIYYTSVGGNSLLLLNLPPDRRGLINEKDVEVMKEFGAHLARSRDQLVPIKEIAAPQAEDGCDIKGVLSDAYDAQTYDPIEYYTPKEERDSYMIKLTLDKPRKINRVKLIENVAFSQRIEEFYIYGYVKGKRVKLCRGTTVGYGRIAFFRPVVTDRIEIEFTQVRRRPYIEFIGVYEDNGYMPKTPLLHKIKLWIHRMNYKVFIDRENKKNKTENR